MKFHGGAPAFRGLALTASLWTFLVIGPVGAQTFHTAYGRIDQFGGLTSVAPTGAPGSIASGYFDEVFTQGMLLKVQPTGSLSWVQAYGDPFPSTVRETVTGFVWNGFGNMGTPSRIEPVVAGVDPAGAVLWAREIHLPFPNGTPGDQVYGRFLELDPKDGGYWVGGEFWRQAFVDSEPWLGKLDSAGKLLWAKVVSFPESARFHSLFPALDGGVIGVGQIWLRDPRGAPQARMLAVKLRADGSFEWGFRYQLYNADRNRSWQWLADVDRDPLSQRPEAAVVGTVTDFCKSIPSVPCNPVRSAAFVATLDETSGHLLNSYGLFSTTKPSTRGVTIVEDMLKEVYGIGGEIAGDTRESQEAFLAFQNLGTGSIRSALAYGDAAGPFDASPWSLARCRNAPDRGYLFVLHEIDWSVPTRANRRNLVRTDLDGSSGACECKTAVTTFRASLDWVPVQPVLRDGWQEEARLVATPVKLPEEPCRTPACQARGPAPRAREAVQAATPKGSTILPGIPGAAEGRRASMPLRVLPLQRGARLAGLAGERGERLTFYLDVPQGAKELEIRTAGGKGNVDILVDRGQPAGAGEAARSSRGSGNQESVRLQQPEPGLWSVTLEGTAEFEGVTLSVEGGS